ncbi:TPA: hypothetical protein O4E20_002299 [Proteus mirabilis]|uniref:hypothetical protein n=1 Tax=Proteus mirabilis TaxID=584 RepID=UPI0008F9232C|nr:hypothetical protein [Proteus mirabilis]MBG2870672.1 hypothetical protein [Proteus mirabilis]MBI6243943.1 hypothetical protein [Proteus mirabilis]MCD4589756.1 hypothetical protein [Proteus mirabilis]MCD4595040.1 hypothetical protein [Proteus mirabilis]MCD4598561.1 hypothetical protein [Proteus mirabilis]
MNQNQNIILKLWEQLTEAEKKELLYHIGPNKLITESVRKFKGESTMNFGQVTTCPTCGR